MHKYKELIIWKKSIGLVTEIYQVTGSFPDKERFNLISQINRAAVSITSNIAEGAGRNSDKEFVQFLAIAHASSYELETQLIVSNNLGYLKQEKLNKLLESIEELQKMNFALQQKLKKV
jgi:four helix bundle protein